MKECRLLLAFGGVICMLGGRERWWTTLVELSCWGVNMACCIWERFASSIEGDRAAVASLVAGRDGKTYARIISWSALSFRLFDPGRGGIESTGSPKTRPAAAAATTAPVPTSCDCVLALSHLR